MNELFLYDEIFPGCAAEFASQFSEACKNGPVTVRMNSVGGSVIEGMGIYALIKSSRVPVTIVIDGIAASIASYIACAGKPVKTRKSSIHMLHSPSSMVWGNANDARTMIDDLERFEAIMINAYSLKTGKTKEELKATYFDGKDNWLTAEQAVELGLADEIIDDILPLDSVSGWENVYTQVLTNKKTLSMFESLKAKLGLGKDASEKEAEERVATLQASLEVEKNDKLALQAKVTAFEKAEGERKTAEATARETEVDSIVAEALKVGKFKPELKDSFTAMLKADFDNAKAIIASMPTGKDLTKVIAKTDDSRKDWTYSDYMKKDSKALAKMKDEDPEAFKALKRN